MAFLAGTSARGEVVELRGWWADTFHAALRNPTEVDALVTNARAANFNAVFVEVRKRGDAYYDSRFEPKASDVQTGFDPLAYLIARAHDTSAGPRLEVHAWMVTYNIWNSQDSPPPQPDHPYRLHPDWLTEAFAGGKWESEGGNFAFDPGHPAVQEHTFNVAMDIVSRYDVDGLHFDYVRYAGRAWGYNPVAVARFNSATGSTGRPAPDDSWWMQWRRDQITSLVRRIYLAATALKPQVKISAATITWTPTATNFTTWLKSAAWSEVLQDWRGWMEEGILDLNVPMAYFRQEIHATAWTEWGRFAMDNRFDRHVALGVGGYLNTISNTVAQMRSARAQTTAAEPGLLVYSYAAPAKDGVPRSDFITAVTAPAAGMHGPPVFESVAKPPPMSWKTNLTLNGISGVVTDARNGKPIEGAQVEACGNLPLMQADANGAYGGFLKSKSSSLVVSAPGYATQFHDWAPFWGKIVGTNFALEPDNSSLRALDLEVTPGASGVVVTWRTTAPGHGRVIHGSGAVCASGGEMRDSLFETRHSVLLGRLPPGGTDKPREHWLRVVSESAELGTNYSHAVRVEPTRWQACAGPREVRRTGGWDFVPYNPHHAASQSEGYWRAPATSGPPTATAIWSAPIEVTGNYDIEYTVVSDLAALGSTYEVLTPRTKFTFKVKQPGMTGKLATNLFLLRGERPEVKLNNHAPGQSTVVADRVFWRLRDGQDEPNSLPARWVEHFFNGQANPPDDADNDGFPNYAEFAFGTDPTHAASHLRLRLEPAAEGGWQIVISPDARRYGLERATDLISGIWEEIPLQWPWPRTLDTGESYAAIPAPSLRTQYYRLKVMPD